MPTEEELVQTIKEIGQRLVDKFKFGYYEKEDIQQELSIVCLKAMETYDGTRPLDNYLWIACKNRLCNLKRNKYIRLEPPCLQCPFFDPKSELSKNQCTKYLNKNNCQEYEEWLKKTERKKSLVNKSIGGDLAQESYYEEKDIDIDIEKISKIIDRELSVEFREDYFKFKYGTKLTVEKRRNLLNEINNIVKKFDLKEF